MLPYYFWLTFTCTTETHTHTQNCQMIHPWNSVQHLAGSVLPPITSPGCTSPGPQHFLMDHLQTWMDGASPPPPLTFVQFPSYLSYWSIILIGHLLLHWGCMLFTWAQVCIYPHKWFPDSCFQFQLGCQTCTHQGTCSALSWLDIFHEKCLHDRVALVGLGENANMSVMPQPSNCECMHCSDWNRWIQVLAD